MTDSHRTLMHIESKLKTHTNIEAAAAAQWERKKINSDNASVFMNIGIGMVVTI